VALIKKSARNRREPVVAGSRDKKLADLGDGGGDDWEKDDQVGITRARPGKIQFAVTLTRPLAESRPIPAPIRCSLYELSTTVFVRLARLRLPPSPTRCRRRHRPSSFTSAQSRQFYPAAYIASRSLPPLPASLSDARARVESTRAWPQTCTYAGRPVTIPNQKAGVTLAPVPVPWPVPYE